MIRGCDAACHLRAAGILLIFAWNGMALPMRENTLRARLATSSEAGSFGGGCEAGVRLLKFLVCWDAAVCAVSAGGFLSVWNGVRKTNVWNGIRKTNDWRLAFWLDPLEFLRARHWCDGNPTTRSGHGSWPLRKGDYEWQSTM